VVRDIKRVTPSVTGRTSKKKDSEWVWVEEILSEFELIVDSCSQPRERPTDYQEPKKF
jgi:hypothetical protein